jgi:hypothetical protein
MMIRSPFVHSGIDIPIFLLDDAIWAAFGGGRSVACMEQT